MEVIKALMPGKLLKLWVGEGTQVLKGTPVAIMESMKMEMTIKADSDGTVQYVTDQEGNFIKKDDIIVKIG